VKSEGGFHGFADFADLGQSKSSIRELSNHGGFVEPAKIAALVLVAVIG